MTHPLVKLDWLTRAIEVNRFHIAQCKEEPKWTIQQTADALNRSIGSVSQDLLLASWSRTHEKQLRRCGNMKDALAFVRDKEREMRLGEI
jgi:hypothetical protein